MTRRSWLAPAALLALAGCPLPQALPETVAAGSSGIGPRIPFELVSPQATFIEVRRDCTSPPAFTLGATVSDRDQLEPVEARWFVDYDPSAGFLARPPEFPPGNGQDFLRPVAPFVYQPADWAAAPPGGIHVVELVVSSGFKALAAGDPLPNRTPVADRDTQTFRWVFRYVDSGGSCGG